MDENTAQELDEALRARLRMAFDAIITDPRKLLAITIGGKFSNSEVALSLIGTTEDLFEIIDTQAAKAGSLVVQQAAAAGAHATERGAALIQEAVSRITDALVLDELPDFVLREPARTRP